MPQNGLVRPGFLYFSNFLSEQESKNLELNASRYGRWISLKNRRVQKGEFLDKLATNYYCLSEFICKIQRVYGRL